MDAAEEPFEVDGIKFKTGTFVIRNADRDTLQQAAKEPGLTVHATQSELKVATHPLAVPRVALVHNRQNTQNDGWFRLGFESLKIPYTYLADTKIRETANLRENFDVVILPPLGGFGPAGVSSVIRGLPMRGKPLPFQVQVNRLTGQVTHRLRFHRRFGNRSSYVSIALLNNIIPCNESEGSGGILGL